MTEVKRIEVVPYDPHWPQLFEEQAIIIRKSLGDNCLAVHHVGSTAIEGLISKPTIDIIVEVKSGQGSIPLLERVGFAYRGEWNIPFKYGFTRRNGVRINLHLFENGHPEIELNLIFRDYLRSHREEREQYALLKNQLLQDESAFQKDGSIFTNYTLRKGEFIRNVLQKAGFTRLRMLKCTDEREVTKAKDFRRKYFFEPHGIEDPYLWTFNHEDHVHLVLYQGTEIIGYAHLQLWHDNRAAVRIIVIDKAKRNNQFGSQFLEACENWLKLKGYKSIHTEASPAALGFYRKSGYIGMPFNDPDGYESDPSDIAMGKVLSGYLKNGGPVCAV